MALPVSVGIYFKGTTDALVELIKKKIYRISFERLGKRFTERTMERR